MTNERSSPRAKRPSLAVYLSVMSFTFAIGSLACSTEEDRAPCPGVCGGATEVVVDLSCAPASVTSATLSGPCSPDATTGGSWPGHRGFICSDKGVTPFVDCSEVFFETSGPGVCHVEIDFADGFTYSADVTYSAEASCACATPFLAASTNKLMVNNPSATCAADAGLTD
jgi:hypothetical protein